MSGTTTSDPRPASADHGNDAAVHAAILRAVIESPRGVVIFALDRQYRYLAFNEAHRETMRAIWNVEIAVGSSMLELIGRDDDRARAKSNFDRALAGEHFAVIEEYGDDRFSRRYYEDLYSPIVAPDGAVVGLTLFLTDITEQRRNSAELEAYRAKLESLVAERTSALRQKEQLYRTLVTNAPVAVVVHRAGVVVYANPAAALLANHPRGENLAGKSLEELFGGGVLARIVDESLSSAGEGGVVRELSVRRADGSSADVEWRTIGVPFDEAAACLSLIVDVSGRKRAESERRELEAKMLQTQKLESLGLLSGSIAHDFNNLLVGVLGNADLALREDNLSEATRQLLLRIKTTATRASELTTQLLAYTGKKPLDVRALDLSAIATEMTDLVRVSVPMNARLTLELAPSLPAFEGDGAQVRQIVMNLVANAADAIGSSPGDIRVRTFACTGASEAALGTALGETVRDRPYVCLEVTDSGVGMDAATRDRIFDPFFTTKGAGRGLGLAAVAGIVRAHGGAIRVTSAPGKGSTFRVSFPSSERAVTPELQPPLAEAWKGQGTVLVADDEPRVRHVFVLMLRALGFDVLEAGNAAECLETFRAHAAEIRILVVDLTMPGGGGREVVRALRAEGRSVPVVLTSGYPEDSLGAELRADHALTFLEKPFDLGTLRWALRRVLDRP